MTRGSSVMRLSAVWWTVILAAALCVSLAVSEAPLAAAAVVLAASATAVLVWRFGALEGLWYLAVAAVPMRHPISIDLHGTVSLFPSDVLMFALLGVVALSGALRGLWRESAAVKLGLALLLLSLPGLFTATRVFWGVASIYRIGLQLSAFAVAFALVRDGAVARRTLFALIAGIAPAALYGVYQSTLPPGSGALPEWSKHLLAYSAAGEPNLRVFATFNHPLRFSHYLTVSFGASLGLLLGRASRLRRFLAGVSAALIAYANLFTYSIAGFLGMVAAVFATVFQVRSKRAMMWILPLLLGALLLASPSALLNKADRVLRGEATTAVARLITYRQAVEIMRDHPLAGVGWGGVRSSLEHEYRITRARAVALSAENYFLQRGMALGIPGLVLALWVAALYFRNVAASGHASERWPRASLAVAGLAYFVQAQTFPAAAEESGLLLWVLLALTERMRTSGEEGGAPGASLTGPDGAPGPSLTGPGSGPDDGDAPEGRRRDDEEGGAR